MVTIQKYPVFIRMPTQDEKPFFENRSGAEAVITTLMKAQRTGWLRLHGFVVLPNALEMVASPIKQGSSGLVAHIQAETIPLLSIIMPQNGFVWARYYSELALKSQRALNARMQMLKLAPVASGISDIAQEYPYSSANPRYLAMVSEYAGFTKGTVTPGKTGPLTPLVHPIGGTDSVEQTSASQSAPTSAEPKPQTGSLSPDNSAQTPPGTTEN